MKNKTLECKHCKQQADRLYFWDSWICCHCYLNCYLKGKLPPIKWPSPKVSAETMNNFIDILKEIKPEYKYDIYNDEETIVIKNVPENEMGKMWKIIEEKIYKKCYSESYMPAFILLKE